MTVTKTVQMTAAGVKTPIGRMWIIAHDGKVLAAELEPRWEALAAWIEKRYGVELTAGKDLGKSPVLEKAAKALDRYFHGHLDAPSRIELALEGSPMQRRIWQSVRSISPGQTITYSQLAAKARKTGAFRAVGAANGANRCAIFIPCHRVVAGSGALQGYGGGIEAKSWLLTHEGVSNNGTRLSDEELSE
jgi:O-6-methylguanine DNA methyltransferase